LSAVTCVTRLDVTKLLCVPDGVLDLVTLTEVVCPVEGCSNLGIQGNYRERCAFYGRKTWFPCVRDDQKKLRPNCCGYEFLGPEFQRNFKPVPCTTCGCELEVCLAIGYSHHGMFRLSSNKSHLSKFVEKKLPLSSKKRAIMMEKPRSFKVAPWHFSPENRKQDKNGQWMVREQEVYFEFDQVKYAFILLSVGT
jgi:hypothetical protein